MVTIRNSRLEWESLWTPNTVSTETSVSFTEWLFCHLHVYQPNSFVCVYVYFYEWLYIYWIRVDRIMLIIMEISSSSIIKTGQYGLKLTLSLLSAWCSSCKTLLLHIMSPPHHPTSTPQTPAGWAPLRPSSCLQHTPHTSTQTSAWPPWQIDSRWPPCLTPSRTGL